MNDQIVIQLIAVLCAVACALPGVFLVLRRVAMMSDALSHVVLLGIVAGFFIAKDFNSPLLVIGASVSGLFTVFLVEWLAGSGRLKRDAAIGLVFPVLFSIAVLIISRYADNIHLDTDAVLLGELAFAPYDRLVWAERDFGPRGLWSMGFLVIINTVLMILFYKELKLSTFDPGLAASLGFSPQLIHYGIMAVTSLTAVQAFDTVGSILVVALIIVPAATAWLMTDRLLVMIAFSVIFAATGAIGGYWISYALDASIAGCMSVSLGGIFLLAYLLAPKRGVIALIFMRRKQKLQFGGDMLTVHLYHHEEDSDMHLENCIAHLGEHLRWGDAFAMRVVRNMEDHGFILQKNNGMLELTAQGRQRAQQVLSLGN